MAPVNLGYIRAASDQLTRINGVSTMMALRVLLESLAMCTVDSYEPIGGV